MLKFRTSILIFLFCNGLLYSSLGQDAEKKITDSIVYYFGNGLEKKGFEFLTALKISKKSSLEEKFFASLYHGRILHEMEKFDQARVEYRNALNIKSSNKNQEDFFKMRAYHNLGDNFFTLLQYDSAYYYCSLSENYNKGVKDEEIYTYNMDILTYIGYLKGEYNYVNQKYLELLAFYKENNKLCFISSTYTKLAKVQNKLKNFTLRDEYIQKAKQNLDKCSGWNNQLMVMITQKEFALEQNDYKSAYTLQNKIDSLEILSLKDVENKKITELNIQYETKIKENNIENLKNKEKIQTSQIENQKKGIWIISLIILFILILFVFIFVNYQKRKKLNKILELTNLDLKRQHLLNQQIFTVISHDFKGPISTLRILLSKKLNLNEHPELIQDYVKDIGSQIEHADSMLDNLLDWSKNELGFKSNEHSVTDLNQLIEMICKQLHSKISEKKLIIKNEILPNTSFPFRSDVLNIVLRNILSNAVKFSFEQGEINISSTLNSISITDFGKGISSKDINKLFKQKMDANLGTNNEIGFGIGLYFSAELLKKHGADIEVESELRKFTRFTITVK